MPFCRKESLCVDFNILLYFLRKLASNFAVFYPQSDKVYSGVFKDKWN